MKKLFNGFTPYTGWLPDGLAVAALWLLCVIFLAPAFLPGRVLLPLDIVVEGMPPWQEVGQVVDLHNPILEDAVYYIFPVKQWTAEVVRQGSLPLWNPYVFTGYPAIYDTQAGLFYPFSLLYYLLPAATAVDLTILLQMMAGTLFMYLYLRQIRLRRLAAVVGGVLFIFNGLMVVWLEWQVVHAAVIWLPLLLVLVERTVQAAAENRENPWVYAAGAGVVLALPWLGGHWNWTLYMSVTAVAYLLWRLLILGRSQWKKMVGIIGVVLGVGVGLSLIQVLPAFAFLSQSHRQPLSWAEVKQFGLLNRLVVVTLPDFFGSPLAGNWWGVDNYNETTIYMGVMALLLAGMALWLRRDRLAAFWGVWGGLGLLLALGAPFYGVLYVLPVFNGLLPSRAGVLVVVCTAVLAAMGVEALSGASFRARAGRVVAGIGGMLVGITAVYLFYYRGQVDLATLRPSLFIFLAFLLAGYGVIGLRLAGRVSAGWFGLIVLALIISDLFLFGADYNTVSTTDALFPPTETDAFLQNATAPLRIVTPAQGVAYRPNTSLVPRIANLSGYGPGIPQRLVDYMNLAEGGEAVRFNRVLLPQSAVDSPLLDALGVGYVVTIDEKWGETAVPALAQNDIQTWSPLTNDKRQAPLVVGEVGLQRVDVALKVVEPGEGGVTLRIFTADGAQELAHSELDTTALAEETAWASFYFSIFPPAWGDSFLLELEHTGEGQVAVGETAGSQAVYQAYVMPRPNLRHEAGKTKVYQRENASPRAYAVPAAVLAASQSEALALVAANADNLDRVVVLETAGKPSPAAGNMADEAGKVMITTYALNEVTLRAEMPQAGFVVLADLYDAGWQAAVDGQPVPIYQANTVSRAVAVPAGTHDIRFVYRPLPFYAGALVSGVVLLAVILFWGWTWRRRS